MWKKIKPYLISILIALGVGGLSALLTRSGMEQFQRIHQPSMTPPEWIFPIVWTILFILMGISSARVFIKRDEDKETADIALRTYGLQLVVNFFWSIIFFNLGAYLFAFIWLLLLWVLIIAMIAQFKRIDAPAAWIQIPYLLWVTFAGYLTLMTWLLNR